jgi:hypothetical protein
MIVRNWLNYLKMENKNLQEIVRINHLGNLLVDERVILKTDIKEVCLL